MSCILESRTGYENLAYNLTDWLLSSRDRDSVRSFFLHLFKIDYWSDPAADYNKNITREINAFCQRLYVFNNKAYTQRYSETAEPATEFKPRKTKGYPCDKREVYLHKALSCVNYQCIDSDEYDESDTHNQLCKILQKLGAVVIERTHGYEAAPWGLE